MTLEALTLGSDPECFFYSDKEEKYIPSIGKLGGTKDMPLPVPRGAILEDNVAAEFNTEPVLYNDGPEAFVDSIVTVREQLASMAKEHDLSLKFVSQADFHPRYLTDPAAMESGCDPDYNIYTKRQNEYPPLSKSTLRYCGGHVHVGHPEIISTPKILSNIISSLDGSIGCAFLLKEGINQRIETYGKFGNFRPKPYGLEYRSVNNSWVEEEDDIKFVREMVAIAVKEAHRGKSWASHIMDINATVALGKHDKIKEKILRRMHPMAYDYVKEKGWA